MGRTPDFILFGEGNYNTLGVLHELSLVNVEPLLLIIGKSKDWRKGNVIGYSKNAKRIVEVDSAENGIKWIFEHKDDFGPGSIIYPTSDTTEMLLDQNYFCLSRHFRFPHANGEGEVSLLMDKGRQIELAKNAGLRVIDSQYTTSPDFSLDRVKYPCMVKPLNSTSGSKSDMRVCRNESELHEALESGKLTDNFVVQQYINNEADYLFLGISFSNGDVWLPAVVIKPGVSAIGEYSHAIVSTDVENFLSEINQARNFIRSTKYVGPFSIEFGREKGKSYFFEMNFRNDGTSHYPLAAGVNIVKAFMDDAPIYLQKAEYEMIDEVCDLRRVLNRELTVNSWIRSFCNAGTYRFYYKGDYGLIIPLFTMAVHRIMDKILRLMKSHN